MEKAITNINTMSSQLEKQLRQAHEAGVVPELRVTNRVSSLLLRLPGKPRGLVLKSGSVKTKAGTIWERVGGDLQTSTAFTGSPYRTARSEWIQLANGRWRKLGTNTDGVYRSTSLGQRYYDENPRRYIVDVPVVIMSEDSRRETHFPMQAPINLHHEDPSFKQRMIEAALEKFGEEWSLSDELAILDRDGDWRYNLLTVQEGEAVAAVDIPLQGVPSCHSWLPFPCSFGDEAFGSGDCVPRQLSKRLGVAKDTLEAFFADIARELYLEGGPPFFDEPWAPELGVTVRMIEALAQKLGFSCHGVHGKILVSRYVCPQWHRPSLAFGFWSGHFYLYEGPDALQSLAHYPVATPSREDALMVPFFASGKGEVSSDLDEWREWDPDHGLPEPPQGTFYVTSLSEFRAIRLHWIQTCGAPHVHLSGCKPSFMVYHSRRRGVAPTAVRLVTKDFHHLLRASKELSVPYRGEAVGSWMLAAVQQLLRRPREPVTQARRDEIVQLQHGLCRACSRTLEAVEIDHIMPVHCSFVSHELQALCPACHAEKTVEQGRRKLSFVSHLSDELWEALEEKPPVRAIVMRLEDAKDKVVHYVDTIQCRKNILLHSDYDWPVFLPHDRIETVDDHELGDFCYVRQPPPLLLGGQRRLDFAGDDPELTAADLLETLPIRGSGWYHRSAVEAALDLGAIGWACVTHRVTATARVPREVLAHCVESALAKLPADLQKAACNHMIGLLAPKTRSKFKLVSSTNPEDALLHRGLVHSSVLRGTDFTDYILETPMRTRQTTKLLYDTILHVEAAQLARRLRALRPTRVYELNTDSILFDTDHPVPDDPRTRHEETREHRLRGLWSLPLVQHPSPRDTAFEDVDEAEALVRLLRGESLYLEGHAGTGKSTFLRRVREALEAQGKTVYCAAKTHVASANVDGRTLDHLSNSFGKGHKLKIDCLIVDELGLVDSHLFAFLASVSTVVPQLVLAGDWMQLPPVCDQYMGYLVRSMRGAPFLRQLKNRLVLAECRRSDWLLFDAYSRLLSPTATLQQHLGDIMALFPAIPGPCRVNLVQCHQWRVKLNDRLQMIYVPHRRGGVPDALYLPYDPPPQPRLNGPQSMYVYPGLQLLGAANVRGLKKGWSYEVVSVDPPVVRDGSADVELQSVEDFLHLFRLAFARTYHAAQGLTFDRVRLWDVTSPYFSKSYLYVGLSRCRTAAGVDFGKGHHGF